MQPQSEVIGMVDSLDVKLARLEVVVEEQGKQITELAGEVKKLVEVMNRGKGAFGAAMTIAAGIGFIAAKFVPMLMER